MVSLHFLFFFLSRLWACVFWLVIVQELHRASFMVVLGSPPGVPQSGGPVILELPLDKIRRPLMRTRTNDSQKVKDLMDSIKEIGLQVPVKVFFFF